MSRRLIRYRREPGLPLISLLMGAAALVLFFCGSSGPLLQYDRAAIGNGELWRLFSSHWTHWSFSHFFWCTATFVGLGSICERLSRKGYLATLAASILIIPLVSWWVDPGMSFYRGLSGLASAVFVFGAGMVMRKTHEEKEWPGFALAAVGGFAFAGKIVFEYVSGSTLFVDSHEQFVPVPLVHLVGGAVGLVMALIFKPEKDHASSA